MTAAHLRYVGEIFLKGLNGTPVNVFEYEIVKKYIPEFFCNVTMYQITCCEDLNAVLLQIDQAWVKYIPNQLGSVALIRLCNTTSREDAIAHINKLFTKEEFFPFVRKYNEIGYANLPVPPEWKMEWKMFSVFGYTAIHLGAVVRLIIGGHQYSPRRKLMHKLLSVMRSLVRTHIICSFCRCDYGNIYQNLHCNHIPYFHLECLKQRLNSVSFELFCPGPNCNQNVDIFGSSTRILMPFELVTISCCVCHTLIELNEFYCREPRCGHIYHQRCMQYNSITRCIDRNCSTRYSTALCNSQSLIGPRNF